MHVREGDPLPPETGERLGEKQSTKSLLGPEFSTCSPGADQAQRTVWSHSLHTPAQPRPDANPQAASPRASALPWYHRLAGSSASILIVPFLFAPHGRIAPVRVSPCCYA